MALHLSILSCGVMSERRCDWTPLFQALFRGHICGEASGQQCEEGMPDLPYWTRNIIVFIIFDKSIRAESWIW